jgi:hypothetical protein
MQWQNDRGDNCNTVRYNNSNNTTTTTTNSILYYVIIIIIIIIQCYNIVTGQLNVIIGELVGEAVARRMHIQHLKQSGNTALLCSIVEMSDMRLPSNDFSY